VRDGSSPNNNGTTAADNGNGGDEDGRASSAVADDSVTIHHNRTVTGNRVGSSMQEEQLRMDRMWDAFASRRQQPQPPQQSQQQQLQQAGVVSSGASALSGVSESAATYQIHQAQRLQQPGGDDFMYAQAHNQGQQQQQQQQQEQEQHREQENQQQQQWHSDSNQPAISPPASEAAAAANLAVDVGPFSHLLEHGPSSTSNEMQALLDLSVSLLHVASVAAARPTGGVGGGAGDHNQPPPPPPPPRRLALDARNGGATFLHQLKGALERARAGVGSLAAAKRGVEADLRELQESVKKVGGVWWRRVPLFRLALMFVRLSMLARS
jgi:hypothetical protein